MMQKILIIIASLWVIGCAQELETEQNDLPNNADQIILTSDQIRKARIRFEKLKLGTLENTVPVSGYVEVPPNQRVMVHSLLTGKIEQIKSLVGNKVKMGQVLAYVKSPQYLELQYSYIETKTRLSFLQKEYERQKELSKDKITAQKELQQTEAEFISAKAKLSYLKQTLESAGTNFNSLDEGKLSDLLAIRSTISGEVSKVGVVLGMQITSDNLLFEVINTKHTHLELRVFEGDIQKIREGQEIRLVKADLDTSATIGEVYLVSNILDEEERFFRVHGHIEDNNLKVGAFINVEILTESKHALIIPERAIQKVEDEYWLYLLESLSGENYNIKPMKVKTGMASNGMIEVLNGTEGMEYVVDGAYYLSSL